MKFVNNLRKLLLNIKVFLKIILFRKLYSDVNKISGIVFSMDRPIQLFALLESYYKYCSDPVPLKILYKSNNNEYLDGYKEIIQYYEKRNISFIKEISFRNDLIRILKDISSKYLFFLVDDNIFKEPFSHSDFLSFPKKENYIFSLRHGKNLNYCYTKDLKQPLPVFNKIHNFLSWDLNKSEIDWKYAFSVDGHIYQTREVLEMTNHISFKAPNSYEATMNVFRFILRRRKGLCYPNSILVNVCLNRVQEEIRNISGDYSPQELLEIWNKGNKINIDFFYKIKNSSAHIEINELPIKKRN